MIVIMRKKNDNKEKDSANNDGDNDDPYDILVMKRMRIKSVAVVGKPMLIL